jgi:hypothetical protein
VEVYNLQEAGYPLAHFQRDLTPVQKLFLALAAPVYQRAVDKAIKEKEKQNKNPDLVTDPSFDERTQKRINEKRRQNSEGIDEQRLRSHIKPR